MITITVYYVRPEYCGNQGYNCEYGNDRYCLHCGDEGVAEVYHEERVRKRLRKDPNTNNHREFKFQTPYVDSRSNVENQTGDNREMTPTKNRKVNDRMDIDKRKQVRGKNKFEKESEKYSVTED